MMLLSEIPKNVRKGKVGFFWIVEDTSGGDVVIGETMSLDKAEPYGDTLTNPNGHYDFWEKMKSSKTKGRDFKNLSPKVFQSEYEEWPRGRVVFQIKTLRFNLLADRRLHTTKRLELLGITFNLPIAQTDYRQDGHYSQPNVTLIEEW